MQRALIRPYRADDFQAVSDICLLTGELGHDATGLYDSDELLPDIYARPYVTLEPELAFVLEVEQRVSGYILGVADTARFVARYRAQWLPGFARKYVHVQPPRTRDEWTRHHGFLPERMLIPELQRYPAHLHIDLLPQHQRQGFGRQLIERLVQALRERGVPGLHLSLAAANTAARAFYDRVGFRELSSSRPDGPLLGIQIS
jgi:ribosomal protein S18 acetylase RimI-like enzyme